MVRRIPFQESYTWGCKMTLAHKMLGEINWEYILVLYRISNSEREDSGFTHQHFELLTGQSPRLVELLMRLWDVYNQRGGISMFQTEMLFREALNEALLSVVNRETTMSRILCSSEYLATFVNTIIKILQFIHLQNKIMLIEIVFLTCLESMQVWGQQNIY